MKRNTFLSVFGVLAAIIILTVAVVLYAQGYRIDFKRGLTTTGVILVKSLPDGAKVYLDGELVAVTDSSITGLTEGTYRLKIEKEGLQAWEKNAAVKTGLVTSITAILPPISPSLTAITQNGAISVTAAPSGTKAVFISQNKLFLLNLNSPFLGFLRTRPQELVPEPEEGEFSRVAVIAFSPDEGQILIKTAAKNWLVTIGQPAASAVSDISQLQSGWELESSLHKSEIVKNLEVPQELTDIAISATAHWSPDERKFLYEKEEGGKRQFWVVNLVDPLPVGEEIHFKVWETADPNLKIFWLADSHHFIVLEGNGVSIVDFDGANRREIFSGTLAERIALSSTDYTQVIILTSFSSTAANLYGISLH